MYVGIVVGSMLGSCDGIMLGSYVDGIMLGSVDGIGDGTYWESWADAVATTARSRIIFWGGDSSSRGIEIVRQRLSVEKFDQISNPVSKICNVCIL